MVTRSNLSSGRGVGQDPEVVDPELEVLGVLGLPADDPDDPAALDPDDPDADDPDDPDELDPELPPPSLFGVGRESVR